MQLQKEFVPGKKMPPGYLEGQLVGRGVRMTRQRRILLKIIEDAERHLNAATILEMARAQDAGIDRVTVYRTIALLKKYDLVDELDLLHLQGEGHYYEQRPLRQHMHLACLGCGMVTEFESPYFEKMKGQIARECDFQVAFSRVEIGGYCGRCRGQKGAAHRARTQQSVAAQKKLDTSPNRPL